jgi:hypothetical protein
MTSSQVLHLNPERRYRALMRLWQLHLSASDPDLAQLRHLHQTLCTEEALLSETHPDLCLQNLQQRIHDAVAVGLPLQLPVWAESYGEALLERLKELDA